jgi:UDP-glucose 4-epimerase
MRSVVTGGAGFIGSHLVDALLARPDARVVVIDNLYRGRIRNLAQHDDDPRLELALGDIRDRPLLEEALTGADVVFHLAAQSNVMGAVSNPRYSFETNVAGTFNVLEAASNAGVHRVIFASSREAYGEARSLPVDEDQPLNAKNTYGASKAAAEAYCRTFAGTFGLETVILRFSNIYGPRDFERVIPIWLERAQAGEPLEVYGGDQIIDFLWVGYAVQALLAACDAPVVNQPLNIASGIGTPIIELARRILELTGSRGELCITPARAAEVRNFVADTRRMRRLLQIEPAADPLEGLRDLIKFSKVSI